MTNRIEQELIEATDLQRKKDETFQKWAGRLIMACHDLSEDEWEKLPADVQNWVNEGARAINKEKSIANFPSDAEEDEPVEPEEEPVEEPEDEGEPVEEEPEERPRGRRRAEPEPEEEPEDERPARSRRRAEPEDEAEPEEEPVEEEEPEAEPEEERPRGRRRAEPEPEEEPEERPRSRREREPVKPKPRRREAAPPPRKVARKSEPEGKGQSATTLMKKMLIRNPKMTTEDILDELAEKHKLKPSRLAMASIRSAFLHSMRVLKEHKLLVDKMANKLP